MVSNHNIRTANIPRGGKKGQVLHKCSDLDYDVGWEYDQTAAIGGGDGSPDGTSYVIATDEEVKEMLSEVFDIK